MNAAAGWYGKIASLGDFASRRLPDDFIARWDGWLQQVVAASRERLGSAWTDFYLSSLVWRFVEWPRAEVATPSVGLLMPSVDKVGRYFPLCVAAALPTPPALGAEWRAVDAWLAGIESAALATLDTRHSAQEFDDALLALPIPLPQHTDTSTASLLDQLRGSGGAPAACRLAPGESIDGLYGQLAVQALARAAAGSSLWWTAAGRSAFICHGLPDAECFVAMLQTQPADTGGG